MDPSGSLVADKAALAILQLEDRSETALGYISLTRGTLHQIDKELQPCKETQMDLESVMMRLNEVPAWVKAWKKTSAWSGADVGLSLVRVHCKNMAEEKLKNLLVVKKKNLKFEDFMETFTKATTRITDGINLETFIDPASPSPEA